MAGVSDRAFRTVCVRRGAGLTFSEMVSAAGLAHGNERTWRLVRPADEERVLAVQLFGSDADIMARQAVRVASELGERLAFVDVNMGCPARKVVKKGEGCALMLDMPRAQRIVAALVRELSGVAVSVKFRSGYHTAQPVAVEFAQRMEQAGASLLCVHGRSAEQLYRGHADWGVVADVKATVTVPVAGSGDVFSHDDARAMRSACGVDAVLVARGARGNPWVFCDYSPSARERVECAREHFELYCRYEGEEHLTPLRAQLSGYVQGLCGAVEFRRELARASTRADFERLFSGALERLT